jgi:hypothetical protein
LSVNALAAVGGVNALLRAASFTKLDAGLSRLAVKQQRTNRLLKLASRPASTTRRQEPLIGGLVRV